MTGSVWLSAGVFGLILGCGAGAPEKPSASVLEARWSGADSGKIEAPATAEWCDSLHLLEILALRGDTGIALALYPKTAFGPGTYPVVVGVRADSNPPSAAVALRWFAETSIRGFQGDSGKIEIREAAPGLFDGTILAHARSATDGSSLTIRGTFSGVQVRPAKRGCVARRSSSDSGAGIH